MSFEDHFSGHADDYARYRPGYPSALFEFLASTVAERRVAWDCACGNGQAARPLRTWFPSVVATDASARQIEAASPSAGIEFRVAEATRSGLDSASVDLITVAQALHWFDVATFYAEARRVLVPGGVLAAWCYRLCRVSNEVDAIVDELYDNIVAGYWPSERRHIDAAYSTLDFPRPLLDTPDFDMQANWRADEMLGYLGTWSAVRRFIEDRGHDPLAALSDELTRCWGEGPRRVRWPLTLLVWRSL